LIRGGLLNLLLAGRDTTSSLLSNLFFMLARHPDKYAKLAEEVRATVPQTGEPPTLEDLRSMKYLRGCINESLRLHPPIPRNSREALRDTTLPTGGGPNGTEPIFVPEGTQVGYQIFSMHRRKDVYGGDADDFVPERWTERNLRPGWAFLPFNGGPRICIGQQFALNLASYIVCRLVQHIDSVESCDSSPWREGLGISCSTGDGAWVRLHQRV
jgi:cytochrome P450